MKMKKIITAINNPKLNEELKKEKNFQIIGKDIQYKEAILEILEKKNNIDLIIISEKILGEIKIEKLIQKIKIINEKIKIIYILEKENKDIEKILNKNNIFEIYYNNKINLNELIKIINKKEINMEEEIIKLKKIIKEKNINYDNKNTRENNKIKKYIENRNFKIKLKSKEKNNLKKSSNKIVTFSGNYKSGKSTMSLAISKYLSEKNYKIFMIDADLEKQDLKTILRKKNRNKKHIKNFYKKERYIKIKYKIKYKKLINKRGNIYFFYIRKQIKLFTLKINNNLFFYYGFKNLFKNIKKEKNIVKIIIAFFKFIKQKYDIIIIDLSKNNNDKINKNILLKSNINFICLEGDLLGVKECKILFNKYTNKWKVNKKSIYIIQNKKNYISMNKNLISKFIHTKNKIFEIKESYFYNIFLNQFFISKILMKNKKIKRELNKIINKIIYI